MGHSNQAEIGGSYERQIQLDLGTQGRPGRSQRACVRILAGYMRDSAELIAIARSCSGAL
jgi:hypothetical protein